jgi:glyoxylase I family protein
MKIEHLGLMMKDPPAAAEWYCRHLGFTLARKIDGSPHTQFLRQSDGSSLLEIYNNPKAPLPDYAAIDPLVLHLAFTVDDVEDERGRLIEAGAKPEGGIDVTDSGDRICMLRDPWGFCLQLVKRAEPMLAPSAD